MSRPDAPALREIRPRRAPWSRWALAAVVTALAVASGVVAGSAAAAVVRGPVRNAAGGCLDGAAAATTTAATTTAAAVRLAACGTGPSQQWSRDADGTLRLAGRCADLQGGATRRDTAVVIAPCTTSTSQRWTVRADGRLRNQKAGLCLQPSRGSLLAGTPATVAACTAATVQRWTVPALSTPAATAPGPTTTTPPPPAVVAWDSDFTGSGVSRFAATPWNVVGAPAPVLVPSPVTPGRRALQFAMPAGGTRAEVEPSLAEFREGDDRWFGFSFVLPAGFPTDVVSWQLLTQWKNDGSGSPPLELDCGRGRLWLSGGYGHPAGSELFSLPVATATTGVRIDLALHVVFSRDPAKGTVDVIRDGVPAVTGYHPPGGTLYPTDATGTATAMSYWKMGLYRDPAITQPARYTLESAKVGASAASVAP